MMTHIAHMTHMEWGRILPPPLGNVFSPPRITLKLYKSDYPLKASQKPVQRIWPILATLIPKKKSSRFVHGLFQTTLLRRSAGNCYLQITTLNSMQHNVLHMT